MRWARGEESGLFPVRLLKVTETMTAENVSGKIQDSWSLPCLIITFPKNDELGLMYIKKECFHIFIVFDRLKARSHSDS